MRSLAVRVVDDNVATLGCKLLANDCAEAAVLELLDVLSRAGVLSLFPSEKKVFEWWKRPTVSHRSRGRYGS